jgi:hypothetical protein
MLEPSRSEGPGMALHFIAFMGTPFLFLTPNGRNSIGLRAPLGLKWLSYAVVLGAMAAVAMGALGAFLYGRRQTIGLSALE